MQRKIENYLHLYLGCKCIADGKLGTIEGVSTMNAGCSGNNPLIFFEDGEVSTGDTDIEEVKPILRRLSDMTEEEKGEWIGLPPDVRVMTPYQFLWFLSRGFDLFGLIDNQLAVDEKTVK